MRDANCRADNITIYICVCQHLCLFFLIAPGQAEWYLQWISSTYLALITVSPRLEGLQEPGIMVNRANNWNYWNNPTSNSCFVAAYYNPSIFLVNKNTLQTNTVSNKCGKGHPATYCMGSLAACGRTLSLCVPPHKQGTTYFAEFRYSLPCSKHCSQGRKGSSIFFQSLQLVSQLHHRLRNHSLLIFILAF